MNKRPISVIVIGWLYIAVGVAGIAAHIREIDPRRPFEADLVLALAVRLLGILSGVFMLRGSDWARWLAVAWISFHVVLSSFSSLRAALLHALLLAVFTYFLFRPTASAFFRGTRTDSTLRL